MKDKTLEIIDNLFVRYPQLNYLRDSLISVVKRISSMKEENKILLCGNGGSMADCEHMAGELNKSFMAKRPISDKLAKKIKTSYEEDSELMIKYLQNGIQSIPLGSLSSSVTAYLNDCEPDLVFAQGVNVFGKKDDILICFSTSGNSKNILYAAKLARLLGMYVVALTGETGGKLKEFSDICLNAPSKETYIIQEYHLPLYHAICAAVEQEIFGWEEG